MTATKDDRPVRTDEATSDQAAGEILTSITPRADIPWASCSVYAPAGQRELLQAAATCPECGAVTVHRLSGPGVDGIRRQGACAHRYRLRPRRVYAPRAAGAA